MIAYYNIARCVLLQSSQTHGRPLHGFVIARASAGVMSLRRKRLHHHWGHERIIVLENCMERTYIHSRRPRGRTRRLRN